MGRRSATAPLSWPSDATRTARHGRPNRPPDSRVPSFSRQLGKRRWVSAPQAGGGIWRTKAWRAGDLANGGLAGAGWLAGGSDGRVKRSTSPPHASTYLPFAKNATAMPLGPACVPIVAPMETVGNSST